jgi:dipeptidyl aminopeptidase/acylaminoacyl peptidase
LQIYPGAGHGFTPEIMADASQRTLNFLRKYLKQAAI